MTKKHFIAAAEQIIRKYENDCQQKTSNAESILVQNVIMFDTFFRQNAKQFDSSMFWDFITVRCNAITLKYHHAKK